MVGFVLLRFEYDGFFGSYYRGPCLLGDGVAALVGIRCASSLSMPVWSRDRFFVVGGGGWERPMIFFSRSGARRLSGSCRR